MASSTASTITETDRRHFAFMKTLINISDELSPGETANVKLFCSHLFPSAKLQKMKRAVDVFIALKQIGKLDQDNLEFIQEILNLIGRADIIGNDLHAYQPPDREIPENPEVQPGTSSENEDEESVYLTVNGYNRMIQETVNRHRASIAHVCRCNRSQVKFRGYKKGKSILVQFSVPRQTMALLRLTAEHSDPRLAFMGVKSLQIGKESPIAVTRNDLIYGA
ncbi:TRIM3 [Branchiostoma lanceolatum]|uniref:TRIM3 protein n=1 Tax=Branchiostoma lanceolatum TaxID=7740 RepID=A0A8K0A456_BRALA|nr:TRIM3 [Branchiostoma lanceolatum]